MAWEQIYISCVFGPLLWTMAINCRWTVFWPIYVQVTLCMMCSLGPGPRWPSPLNWRYMRSAVRVCASYHLAMSSSCNAPLYRWTRVE